MLYMAVETLSSGMITFILLVAVWELIWKGIALWRTARASEKTWFFFILIVNSIGVLPIVYLYFFDKEYGVLHRKKKRRK